MRRSDLRCEGGRLLGRIDGNRLEVICNRCRDALRKTGGADAVVFHYVSFKDGRPAITETRIYANADADPARRSQAEVSEEDLDRAVTQLGWRR